MGMVRRSSVKWWTNVLTCSRGVKNTGNEDYVGYVVAGNRLSAWVIDGASPLVKTGRIYGSSGLDVQWFVRQIGQYLRKYSLRVSNPRDLFLQVREFVYEAYFSLARDGRNTPLFECPLAAVSWVRVDSGDKKVNVDYLCLGDCPFFLVSATNHLIVEVSGDATAERMVRDRVNEALKIGVVADIASLSTHLRARREQQHVRPSTGVFSMNPDGIRCAVVGNLKTEETFDVVMATDGLFRLVDLFKRYSLSEFCMRCRHGDFKSMIRELRHLEDSATLRLQYPRLKRHDDASGLLVQCHAR